LAAFSWIDGNAVHLLTTADGTEKSKVTRRVGSEQQQYAAPVAVPRYNKGMQAIDRFDQLLSCFHLPAATR
jgi:hypothetical protein